MPANRSALEQVAQAVRPDAESIDHLGTGGFASTFRVRRPDGTVAAMKVIDPTIASVERVDRELAALRRVDHPNVVKYRDFGSQEFQGHTYHWIEMDYIEGESLATAIRGGKVFTAREAVTLLHSAVAGASAIWAAGTAHRDLSPSNLLLSREGSVVIVDLGLARHVDDVTITVLPTPGTPGWMSPEQVGATPTHGDWRSDQFVLGLLGYLLLAGVQPYTAVNPLELWQAPAVQSPRPIRAVRPGVPSVATDIVERMLERQPHRRYLRPAALLDDLERALVALGLETDSAEPAPAFYLVIGQRKNFVTPTFLDELRPAGLVIDAQARARVSEFCAAAFDAGALAAIDPVTHFARSPLEVRPAGYQRLVHGTSPVLTGFADDAARREWCLPVVESQLAEQPEAVIAPYFYAGSGELGWINESLACARVVSEIVSSREDETKPSIWTAVAIASTWLADGHDRDALLTALTGQQAEALYLLVTTPQPSFGPLADVTVLRGFRDLLGVMRDADVPVIVGRRATSGLLLLALGAAGWSSGVTGNLMNMVPHPEAEQDGGPGYDRVYVPRLLNHVSAPIYDLMQRARPELVRLETHQGRGLLESNPTLEELTTAQRQMLVQHNLLAMGNQVRELATRAPGQRVELMRGWVIQAAEAYSALPPTRLPGEGPDFLAAWMQVL